MSTSSRLTLVFLYVVSNKPFYQHAKKTSQLPGDYGQKTPSWNPSCITAIELFRQTALRILL